MTFADKLSKLVDDRGWKQADVVRAIAADESAKASKDKVSRWFSGKAIPDIREGLVLARMLGVGLDYLADDSLDHEPRVGLTTDEAIVLSAYRVQVIEEGPQSLSPDEASLRLRRPSGRQLTPPESEGTPYSAGPATDPASRVKAG